jgi:hypothetical protein
MVKKSNTGKVLLVGAALSLCMLAAIVFSGVWLFGAEWNGSGVTLIAFATGLVGHRIAERHYQKPARV